MLRETIEQKEREIREKDQLIQELQQKLVRFYRTTYLQSARELKVAQFDSLARLFMEQNTKLKAKDEEIKNLATVVQRYTVPSAAHVD